MIKLIVGLGNPGQRYLKTRHNAGFWFLDALIASAQGDWRVEKKFHGDYAKVLVGKQAVHLLKPQTFMNHSGRSVSALAKFYDIALDELLVVHDELDLPEGQAKLKFAGGHGGHNGLRDIISACGGREFYRLRLGIDHPGDRSQVVDYVLKPPSKSGVAAIEASIIDGLNVLPILVNEGAEKAMHQLHTRH